MECPPPPGSPTFKDELKRGVNPFNLSVGVLTSLAAGIIALFLVPWTTALAVGAGLFLTITLLHTAAHAGMGFVFERGLEAHCRGDYRRAERWLRPAAWKGMDHYDPRGVALQALKECRERNL